jgi:hypothetical protein
LVPNRSNDVSDVEITGGCGDHAVAGNLNGSVGFAAGNTNGSVGLAATCAARWLGLDNVISRAWGHVFASHHDI